MKVMLTGSTGFIGGHIMKALIEAGHEVQALVRDKAKLESMKAIQGIGGLRCMCPRRSFHQLRP